MCEVRENFYGKVQSEDIKIMYKHFLETLPSLVIYKNAYLRVGYKRFVYGRKFMDRPAGSFGFFFFGFWEELFRANWTLADKRRNANLSLCHVLPYGNIICKYFYVRYVTRDWAAHVKQRHYRIGRQILRWRGALVSA